MDTEKDEARKRMLYNINALRYYIGCSDVEELNYDIIQSYLDFLKGEFDCMKMGRYDLCPINSYLIFLSDKEDKKKR